MRNVFFRLWAKLTGRNSRYTPVDVIREQMLEPRPLPMGRQEFEEWSDRIIGGAVLPTAHLEGKDKLAVFIEGQKFALANLLLHLGPTESHKPDSFFIHSLRKFAVNQVADNIRVEIRESGKKRLDAEAAARKAAEGDDEDAPITLHNAVEAQAPSIN